MEITHLSREINNYRTLASMHHLRWQVFVNRLHWKDGLQDLNFMEFDSYDNKDAVYLIHKNKQDIVDASVRLIPTNKPYMIKDHYPDYIHEQRCPDDEKIFEITRFCFSPELARDRISNPAAYLAGACIEYGLAHGIKKYIALTNTSVKSMIERAGWDPKLMGDIKYTPDQKQSVVCEYSVNKEILQRIKDKNNISGKCFYPNEQDIHDRICQLRNNAASIQKSGLYVDELGINLADNNKTTSQVLPFQTQQYLPCANLV